MKPKLYPKGSEWRKWDLHIHTPKSIVQNYGGDTPEIWEKFITDLENLPPEFKVIGINDYVFLDGYNEVLKYRKAGRLKNIDLVLPVIELRIDKFASQAEEAWKKVNLHIIFSNELDPATIQSQFLSAIPCKATIYDTGEELQGVVTYEYLNELGKQVIETASKPPSGSAVFVGFSNLVFDYAKVNEALKSSFFKGKFLTAVGKSEWDKMRWDSAPAQKKTIINNANFVFHALENDADHIKHKDALSAQKVNSKLIDCSDAHDFSNSTHKDRIGNCFTWINADPTFEGLKQVSNDPSRIFIGPKPPLVVRFHANKTKFIRSLAISKVIGSTLSEQWFDGLEIPFNPSLVAIIGNKGNGKSALADTLGLVGNTPNFLYFSFLTDKKFRNRRPTNKSDQFEATLTWADGSPDKSRLSQNPTNTSIEKIKYIPQGFLERLCNDELDDFEDELRKVIFSHIDETDRLQKGSLNELIAYKTEVLNREIEDIKSTLSTTNRTIIDLEGKKTDGHKKGIEENLREKSLELKAHEEVKPKPINPPDDPAVVESNKTISEEISGKREDLTKLDANVAEKTSVLKKAKIDVADLERIAQSIGAFEGQFQRLQLEVTDKLKEFDISFDKVVSISVNKSIIEDIVKNKTDTIIENNNDLNEDDPKTVAGQRIKILSEIQILQDKLDEPSKLFQKYLDDQRDWEEKKAVIVGTEDKEGTIKYFKAQLEYLQNQLNDDLEHLYLERKQIVKNLFLKKNIIIDLYKSLFKPVSEFINTYGNLLEDYSINLDVDYKIVGFPEKFFDHVSLGARGSFIGNPAGIERLVNILQNHELKTEEGLLTFLDEIVENLQSDHRAEFSKESREIINQLKKGYTVQDFYSFLFNLDYLEPEYKLKLGEKDISELSPGERGALLLIFYLTIDQSDIPLVIDQPEENLDNQSVFKILVQFIKQAKTKRQIILVTHNPNLAVACNAEQIIYVHIDKKDRNIVSFVSGSLENEIINNAVIDILEGTYPALRTRTNTYEIIVRKP